MNTWAVAVTQPRSERKALLHAQQKGFECFLPLIRNTRKREVEPLFPRYIFVNAKGAWRTLLSTVGIFDVVKVGMTPATLSNDALDSIRQRCDSNGCLIQPSRFSENQKIKIVRGPFEGMNGTFHSMRGRDRVMVLLALFGRVIVSEDDLMAA